MALSCEKMVPNNPPLGWPVNSSSRHPPPPQSTPLHSTPGEGGGCHLRQKTMAPRALKRFFVSLQWSRSGKVRSVSWRMVPWGYWGGEASRSGGPLHRGRGAGTSDVA